MDWMIFLGIDAIGAKKDIPMPKYFYLPYTTLTNLVALLTFPSISK